MFPKGERAHPTTKPSGQQAHPTTKPSGQQGSDVSQRETSLSPRPGRPVLWCVAASDRWKCAGT